MCLLSFLAAFAPAAQADESEVRVQVEQERSDEDSMSVMEYAWYGLGDGLGVGLAAGYLATGSEFTSDEWDTLALGAGIGALGGMGLGLVLGVADVGQDGPGIGAAALQNISYGLGLGGVAGLIVGGIVAIDSSDTKDVLIGGSIGAVSGAGVGLIVGLIQGAAGDEVEADDDLDDDGFALVDLTVQSKRDVAGKMVWMPTAHGTF